MSTATFAAGCFWGTERFYKKQFGKANPAGPILNYAVGYMAGSLDTTPPRAESPGYKNVCKGDTGLAEVLNVVYDPAKVKFDDLCYFFFRIHEPTTLNRQHGDVGTQYRSAVMVHDAEQRKVVERIIKEFTTGQPVEGQTSPAVAAELPQWKEKFDKAFKGKPIVTTVEPATKFFVAEGYHQEYLDVNPDGYCTHRIYW